jgi:sulfur-oxidizing protein SoxZ
MLARVRIPETARRGEVIPVRIAIQHPMETGFRYDNVGQTIAKNVIHTLVVRYNGAEIFRAEMGSGIAANPYLEFHTVAAESGELEFSWADDAGARGAVRASITVVG